MKILHITDKNIFFESAYSVFEKVYPGGNFVWLFGDEKIDGLDEACYKNFLRPETINPFFINNLKEYDLVVLHKMNPVWYPIVALAPKNVRFAWLGWGGDYYGYIYSCESYMLLEKTKKIYYQCVNDRKKCSLLDLVKLPLRYFFNVVIRDIALKRVGSFSPVIPEEYNLIKEVGSISYLPPFVPWNYTDFESEFKSMEGFDTVLGKDILLGNSAEFTNNHIEAIDIISRAPVVANHLSKVFIPLSYGERYCRNEVMEYAEKNNGDYVPIVDFLPIREYVSLVRKCGFVVMNHIRQQAVGNIIIMLYLGAKIFLREESPVYRMMKNEGGVIYSIQELEGDLGLLEKPLSKDDIKINRDLLKKHWSTEAVMKKTKKLVDFHIG